ncbi:4Fe-4S binding protein [bacterium]|nr:4Fe-4S binding protein [bacterium]MBU1984107.1 4Fe-4S binding protein [bacterium]
MSDSILPIHYVCTHEQARALIEARRQFFISNCGCREDHGACKRSRMDVCLSFSASDTGSGTGLRPATLEDALAILLEAQNKQLVARPFRNDDRNATSGICFCCDDCCSYFANPEEPCDRGELVAATDFDDCTHCGFCMDVCHFHAREMMDGKLVERIDACYGCGLCVSACPEECISMRARY